MIETPPYHVDAERQPRGWTATVADLHNVTAQARTLAALDVRVREALAAALQLPATAAGDLALAYEYHVGPPQLGAAAAQIRADRARLDDEERRLAVRTKAAAEVLTRQLDVGVRDAAVVLGVSPGRISQLVPRTNK